MKCVRAVWLIVVRQQSSQVLSTALQLYSSFLWSTAFIFLVTSKTTFTLKLNRLTCLVDFHCVFIYSFSVTCAAGVLDHLVWSNHKRNQPGRDDSLLQTETSSKGRESAMQEEVSSFGPELRRQDSLSHFELIECLAWQPYKEINRNMF